MEGSICALPAIVRIAKRYKAYVYLDEAHSIGALGARGRGVCDHYGIAPTDVDLLMGTFTKSFGAAGGYIGGSKRVIDFIRTRAHAQFYATAMAPPIVRQIQGALAFIDTARGRKLIGKLQTNTVYFREQLSAAGFVVIGDRHSPVVPLMLYHTAKIAFFNRQLDAYGVAVACVGFPVSVP